MGILAASEVASKSRPTELELRLNRLWPVLLPVSDQRFGSRGPSPAEQCAVKVQET